MPRQSPPSQKSSPPSRPPQRPSPSESTRGAATENRPPPAGKERGLGELLEERGDRPVGQTNDAAPAAGREGDVAGAPREVDDRAKESGTGAREGAPASSAEAAPEHAVESAPAADGKPKGDPAKPKGDPAKPKAESSATDKPEPPAKDETTRLAASVVTTTAQAEKPVTIYRLYNSWNGQHLFTKDANENRVLQKRGWTSEGTAWTASDSGREVWRLYNPNSGDHHYTTDRNEYDSLRRIGWRGEGVAWRSSDSKGVTLYRFFNPNVSVGTHHYSSDPRERLTIVARGWVFEGSAWFGIDTGPTAPETDKTGWVKSGGATFYRKSDQSYATGWQQVEGKRRHFDSKGRLSTGVLYEGDKTYYLSNDGSPKTGDQAIDGYWYYFDQKSGAAIRGWRQFGRDHRYYDRTSSAMAVGYRTIDGVVRYFDASGSCDKVGYQIRWKGLRTSKNNVVLPSYAWGSYWSYVHPSNLAVDATREQCIETFIGVAYEYMNAGTRWVDNACSWPGTTVDCSGMIMEGLYACGIDLSGAAGGPFDPYSKYYWNPSFSDTWRYNDTFQPVSVSSIERGDILFWPGHVAIYLGNGQIIESTAGSYWNVRVTRWNVWGTPLEAQRPFTK